METYTAEQRELIKSLGLSVNSDNLVDFDENGGITYLVKINTKEITND
jgi:hypothetical protein